jgi:hypothetical protein
MHKAAVVATASLKEHRQAVFKIYQRMQNGWLM